MTSAGTLGKLQCHAPHLLLQTFRAVPLKLRSGQTARKHSDTSRQLLIPLRLWLSEVRLPPQIWCVCLSRLAFSTLDCLCSGGPKACLPLA